MDVPLGMWSCAVFLDRYNGAYTPTGGAWLAVADYYEYGREVWRGAMADDCTAMEFWANHEASWWIADATDPNAAVQKLIDRHFHRMHGMTRVEAARGEGLK